MRQSTEDSRLKMLSTENLQTRYAENPIKRKREKRENKKKRGKRKWRREIRACRERS